MKGRTQRLLLTVALSALGAVALIALTRALAVQVQAESDAESGLDERTITSQAMYDLQPLMIDAYDGTFTTTYQVQRAITYTGSSPYGWGRVLSSTAGFTDTLWCVGDGSGTALDPDTDSYPNSVSTTVTYGPLNLRKAITVEVEFAHWLQLGAGDAFEWGYSVDGTSFTYAAVAHITPGSWETTTLSSVGGPPLDSLLDQEQVYLAFRFQSNGSGTGRGVFLDNVQVRATYDVTTYLPVVPNDWFIEYTYTEDFEPPWSNWPYGYHYVASMADDLRQDPVHSLNVHEFEDTDEYGIATAIQFSYGYKHDDDGSNIYYISVEDNYDHVFLTGPAYLNGDNWEYEAWMRRATDSGTDLREYGLLISPTPIDPKNPSAEDVYTFHMRHWDNGIWVVKKWDIHNSDDHPADEIERGTGNITRDYKVWNQFRIERRGNTLYFKLQRDPYNPGSYQTVYTLTDPALSEMYYIGFFVANHAVSTWREWQFDNVYVHAAP